MSHLQQRVLWCIAVLGIAAAAAAQETSIQLPPDNPVARLKTGAGDEVVRRSCALCHSTDYIVRQPHLDAQRWDAEVKKMIAVYGARISDADARIIADYLARNYGTDGAEPKKSTVKPPGGEPLFFPTRDSVAHAHAVSSDPRLLMDGTSLASFEGVVSEIASPHTYNEPTVMWRMRHRDGRWAQAVIDPMDSGARVLWFVNGHPLAARYFADWTSAIEWTARLRAQQWTVGWRLTDDIAEGPPAGSGS